MTYCGQMRNQTYRSVFLSRVGVLDAFIGLLWAIQVVNRVTGYRLNSALGLIPRRTFGHLIANTPPLLVTSGLLAATATRALLSVNDPHWGLGPDLRLDRISRGARSLRPFARHIGHETHRRPVVRATSVGCTARPNGRVVGEPSFRGHPGWSCSFLVKTHVRAPHLGDEDRV